MIARRRAFQRDVEQSIRAGKSKMAQTANGEISIPPHPGDYGFHYSDINYLSMVAQILERSNYTAWPDEGGLNDQDMNLIEDILKYLSVRDWVEFESEYPDLAYQHFQPASGEEVISIDLSRE